jgi:hypothetical protein
MKFANRDDLHPFEPPGQEKVPEAERRRYTLRTPLKRDKVTLSQLVRARGGRHVAEDIVRARQIEAVEAIAGADEALREMQLAIVERHAEARKRLALAAELAPEPQRLAANRAFYFAVRGAKIGRDALPEDLPEDLAALAIEACAAARAYWDLALVLESHDAMLAQYAASNESYDAVFNLEAAALFVVDWQNLAGRPALKGGRLDPASLEAIPDEDIAWIGVKALELMTVAASEAKNSAAPSGTGTTPDSSRAPSALH